MCVSLLCGSENKRKAEMIEQLKAGGYPSDPVRAWKESLTEGREEEEEGEEGEEGGEREEEGGEREDGKSDYNYLLAMQLWSLTKEKKEELLKARDKKVCVCVCV